MYSLKCPFTNRTSNNKLNIHERHYFLRYNEDVEGRIAKARDVFPEMKKSWKPKIIGLQTKNRILKVRIYLKVKKYSKKKIISTTKLLNIESRIFCL